jgi:hypothetical protein
MTADPDELQRTREQLRDIIGESACCNDNACACHQAAWEAREELDARAENFNRGPANALALMASSLLDVDTAQTASNTEPGWESYEGLSPLEARYADGDR